MRSNTFSERMPLMVTASMLGLMLIIIAGAFIIPDDASHLWMSIPAPRDGLECFRYLHKEIVCIPTDK
jgi:hypothetical protein